MNGALLDLLIDKDWRDNAWITSTSGDGVVSPASGILTTTATTGQAQMWFYVPVAPGTYVEVEVMARKLSGSATGTGVYLYLIDQAVAGPLAVGRDVSGNDWKSYTLGYTVPLNEATDTKFVLVRFGVQTGVSGDARFQLPTIRIGRGPGMPMVIARGVVQCIGGSPGLLTDRVNHGINGVSFNGTDTLTVTLRHALPGSPKPLVLLTGEQGQPARIPMAGAVTSGVGPTIQIKFTNGAAIQNIAAGTTYAYLMVLW